MAGLGEAHVQSAAQTSAAVHSAHSLAENPATNMYTTLQNTFISLKAL